MADNGNDMLNISNTRQVFIDGRWLEQSRGVELVVQRPVKTDERNIAQEHSWESYQLGYTTVIYHNGSYHMWYDANGLDVEPGEPFDTAEIFGKPEGPPNKHEQIRSLCYATSSDGIRWEKPRLRLSTGLKNNDNNIVAGYGAGGIEKHFKGAVFLDPNAPKSERFKMVGKSGGHIAGLPGEGGAPGRRPALQLFSSPDGIHWEGADWGIVTDRESAHMDTHNIVFWDKRIGRYVGYLRKNTNPAGFGQFRTVSRLESADLHAMGDVADSRVVLQADTLDPAVYSEQIAAKIPVVDYYTPHVVQYPWAADAYYLFPATYLKYNASYLHEFEDQDIPAPPNATIEPYGPLPINTGPLDIQFAASRDGIVFQRYDRRAFIELGTNGSFDSKALYAAWGIVPSRDNESELFMYYKGSDRLHGWNRHRRNNAMIERAGLGPTCGEKSEAISRVKIRRDGFVAARADYSGGSFVTPLLTFSGDSLELNVNTSAAGMLRVEIQDEDGRFIDGYRLEDCDRIHTSNEIHRRVSWRGRHSVRELAGRPVKLRFSMWDTDLYAFQFVNRG